MSEWKALFGFSAQPDMAPIQTMLSNSMEEALQSTFPLKVDGPESSEVWTTDNILLHVLIILRHVSQRDLYGFSGWQATADEVQQSKNSLRTWMQTNAKSARKCLWHAVMAFSTFRNKEHIDCHEPLFVALAVQFIRAFTESAKPSESSGFPTRIDRLSDISEVHRWIERGGESSIHVTGIGLLQGTESLTRLMIEFRRILLSRKSWFGICRGVAYITEQIIQGRPPLVPEDKSNDAS